MFRDRTNLYVSYRRTYPRNTFRSTQQQQQPQQEGAYGREEGIPMLDNMQGDLRSNDDDRNNSLQMIIENILKPIDLKLATIDDLINNELIKLYKKVMLPSFQDKTEDINQIENLNYKIIKYLQMCSNSIKLCTAGGASSSNGINIILENLNKAYARKIQKRSNNFRIIQNNYLKFLNKDDFKPLPTLTNKTDDDDDNDDTDMLLIEENDSLVNYSEDILLQKQQNRSSATQQKSTYLKKRDQEIQELAKGVLEVSTIFKELQDLIIDQGSIIDRVDYNVELTSTTVQDAQKELTTATRYQKREGKCKIILFLILLCFLLFMLFMIKIK